MYHRTAKWTVITVALHQDLLSGLAELVVRRKINDDGEFAYVFLASGEQVCDTAYWTLFTLCTLQIPGKKAAYKRLKSEEAVFEALKDSHQVQCAL